MSACMCVCPLFLGALKQVGTNHEDMIVSHRHDTIHHAEETICDTSKVIEDQVSCKHDGIILEMEITIIEKVFNKEHRFRNQCEKLSIKQGGTSMGCEESN